MSVAPYAAKLSNQDSTIVECCTGPPKIETAAATGIDSGGKDKEIRDEARAYQRHAQTARWRRFGWRR